MKFKKLYIIICFFIICAPSAFIKVKEINNYFHINENRSFHSFPRINNPIAIRTNYKEIENWYNDNFAFRDFLIRFQHTIDYYIFKYSKQLVFDNKNYFYYRTVTESEQIFNEYLINDINNSALINTCKAYNEIKKYLEQKGISIKFIIPPQKNEIIYDSKEYLNVNRPDLNAYFRMEAYFLQNGLENNYIPLTNLLREKNLILPIYYKCDFHWNDYGAAIAFSEVINSYSKDIGKNTLINTEDFFRPLPIKESSYNNQLDNLSVLFFNIPYSITVQNKSEIDYFPYSCDYPNINCWENNKNALLDGAVFFIGDSYTPPALFNFNGTYSGLSGIFEKTYFCHWNNSEGILNDLPQDIKLVVIEIIESNQFHYETINKLIHSNDEI